MELAGYMVFGGLIGSVVMFIIMATNMATAVNGVEGKRFIFVHIVGMVGMVISGVTVTAGIIWGIYNIVMKVIE